MPTKPTKREAKRSLELLGVLSGKLEINDCTVLGKAPPRRKQNEAAEQKALFEWAKLHEHIYPALRLMFAIPNGGSRKGGIIEGAHLKAQGVRAGVPDLFLPYPSGRYHGLFLEMKADGGRLQPAQREWIDALNNAGYFATVAFGFEQAKNTILRYLNAKADFC